MRVAYVLLCLTSLITTSFASWSKEDQEIFRLRHEIEVSEGLGVTFYDFLGTKSSASQDDINKAYRKKSRILHPDKVKQQFIREQQSKKKPKQSEIRAAKKAASDRFSRLSLVANILRGPGRDRYDYFLNYGFPAWKGTGYYYARYRPGLLSVLIGLFVFVGGISHWIVLYLSWKRQRNFINRYINFAKSSARGDIPGLENITGTINPGTAVARPVNRRQRRMQDRDSKKEKISSVEKMHKISCTVIPDSNRPRKRVVAENGKILVVDSVGQVFLEQVDGDGEVQEFLLDPNEFHQPKFSDTALCQLPMWIFDRIFTILYSKKNTPIAETKESENDIDTANSSEDNFELLDNVKKIAENGTSNSLQKKKSRKRG